MQRMIYAYDVEFNSSRGKGVKVPTNFLDDLADVMEQVCKYKKSRKKEDFLAEKKIMYINNVTYDKTQKVLELVFISARYGLVRSVMNTKTFFNRGPLKNRPDGDLEKTHVTLKFLEDNHALGLVESNRDGIGWGKIIYYINMFVDKYHKSKKDMYYYTIKHKNMVSEDFLKSLEMLDRIKVVTLTMDQEDVGVSETKAFAGINDISGDVDIVLKPTGRGKGIRQNTVKDFYNKYNDKSLKIKRITVEGDRETKDPLVFDTERMKQKYPVEVLEESNGEVKSFDIFREMRTLCRYY
ncbi:hypothetical protein ACOAOT_14240 [Lacrimispora sp. AGF001]|uniref:hypothetical protein n=1 Tax=Lacrimispora sp. AGF001 TaxID=3401631 RepID=UPI003B432E65